MKIKRIKASNSGKFIVVDLQKKLIIYRLHNGVLGKCDEKAFDYNIMSLDCTNSDVLIIAQKDGTIMIWDHSIGRLPLYLNLSKIHKIKSCFDGHLYASTVASLHRIKFPYLSVMHEAINITATSFSIDSKYLFFSFRNHLKALNLQNGSYHDMVSFNYDITRIEVVDINSILFISKSCFNLFLFDKMMGQVITNTDNDSIMQLHMIQLLLKYILQE